MTKEEIRQLPTKEKFLLMESLWDDLKERYKEAEIPESHRSLLVSRRERAESGDSMLLEWDSVKATLGHP